MEQQTVLRQLEAILSVYKPVRLGHHLEALREIAKLPFLPLDPRTPHTAPDVFQNLSPHVQACVPDLLKVALSCLDNVADTDGSLRAMRTKVCLLQMAMVNVLVSQSCMQVIDLEGTLNKFI